MEAPAPLFTSLLNYRHGAAKARSAQAVAAARAAAGGMRLLHAEERSNYPLGLAVDDRGDRFRLTVQAAHAFVDPARVCRYVHRALEGLVEALETAPGRAVTSVDVLPAPERRQVLEEWNDAAAGRPSERCMHELVEGWAARTPDAVALNVGGETLSYAGLNRRANRLAHHLRALGVGPEVRVGVCVERGLEMILGPLAVLKAGGAFLPLDPALPDERLRYMVRDGGAALVLAQDAWAPRFAGVPVLALDGRAWADAPDGNLGRGGLTPAHAAYVVYTSGSTGTPKGVVVPHRGVSTLVESQEHAYRTGPESRVLQSLSFGFDACVWEVYVALGRGAMLHVTPPGLVAGDPLKDAAARHAITHLMLTTATLATLDPDARMDAVHTLIVGGEALTDGVARRWADGRRLLNGYGPTEATIGTTFHEYRPGGAANGGVPIGRPFLGWRVCVLDARGEPAPVGAVGEMFVGGPGVARGYQGRPALTAERFVPDAFGGEAGARLYRTGDLGRWRPDGTLDFVGRNDHQVKIRGFRVEPGEVEARLLDHPAVREAAVVPREDAPGRKRLVAYYVADGPLEADGVRAHLAARLPEFMVPAAYVRLPALPLTPNRKLDRKALPAPEGDAYASRAYEAPVGETEQALAAIWAEVLGVERVGRRDSFFDLGGHSLLAVQVVTRVRQVLGVKAALAELFTRPVLGEFARGLERAARADLPPIEPAPRGGRLPLSLAQTRLWFMEQLGDLGSAYHIHAPVRLRGALDRAALARALDGVVARHEALRTTFAETDGVPEQRIARAEVGFHLVEDDLRGRADAPAELERLMAREARAPFDLGRGPLIRGRLVRMAADEHVLLFTMHHLVSDGWSLGVLFAELSALYAAHARGGAGELAELPVQYADYAVWQRRWAQGGVLREQAEYWTRTLAGAPELLELPTDHARPAQMDHAAALLPLALDEELTAGLKALSRRHGTTLYMTLLAGWAAVLARLSGQDDVVIGSPMAGRGRREIEGLIGFFINTLALRVDLSGAPTVAELLGRVKARALEAQHHQDIPFEQVVELVDPVRSLAHSPVFQVIFVWQSTPWLQGLSLPGVRLESVGAAPSHAYAETDLYLSLHEAGERIEGWVTYATALFEPETVRRHLGYLRRVLRGMVAAEGEPVERLALLPADERSLVVDEWNRTEAAYPAESCLHELVQAQAARTPAATALAWDGGRLGYRELNARANRLAHHLRALGVGPDVRVGICVERGPDMVVGLLGVLKAGGAYLPLDLAYPAERLGYMLADSRPAVLLASSSTADRFARPGVPLLALDVDEAWADRPGTDPERGALTPDHLAYVIYTSGSTGRPKGVMVPHRGACNLVSAQVAAFAVEPESHVLQFASFSFDASVSEVLMALCRGAALHLPPAGAVLAGETLERALDGITHVTLPPSVLATLGDDARLESVRTLVTAGEALPGSAARRWAPGRRLVNAYGPTEATVCAALHPCRGDEEGGPPLGRPLANVRVYVLDRRGDPVPVGVTGELYVGGAGVARGYLGRPALTAERFVPDPFGGRPGARLYRTGDLGRWRPDGTLAFAGRADHQVKVRGYRIEPGEIEARLREHPGVREAAVVAREDAPGEKRLVAYVVGDDTAAADALRAHLAAALPEYMVPGAYVRLERLPLTPNGKLDRAALPSPEGDAHAAQAYEAPLGDTERTLAAIWAEVLGIDRVGRRDNFFELGGHSLLAVQVIARMREVGLHLEVQALFELPTLAALAAEVGGDSREVEVPENRIPAGCRAITPGMLPLVELTAEEIDHVVAGVPGGAANVQDIYPLARLQEGVLFHHLMATEGDPYLAAILYSFAGREGLDRYLAAFQAVVDRHDILRTSVAWEGVREPVQVVWRRARLEVEEVELDPALGPVADQLRARFDPRHYRIDVRRAPMLRLCIAHDPAEERWLLLLLDHHLTGDHTAKEVMQVEIEAHLAGRAESLPAPLPFRNYVAQARLGVSDDEHREFFHEMLGDVDEPTAPFGLLDARGDGSGIDEAQVVVDVALAARLRERVRALGVSAASVCHLAWAQVLARVSGRGDVVFGTVLFGRMQGGEGSDRVMGPFINTLPIRIRLDGVGVEDGVRQTHALLARLLRHEHASLALAQRCSAVDASAPLFTSLMNYRHGGGAPPPDDAGAGVEGMRVILGEERSNYPLTMSVTDLGEGGSGLTGFGLTAKIKARGEAARVCAMMVAALEGVVAALETAPGRPLAAVDVLPASERARLLEEWNRTAAAYPDRACVHELFAAQAARTPDAPALVYQGRTLTYAALNARANRLAHHLAARGVGPDVRVGVCLERGPGMVEGVLAVLKAGGAYVPLDPEYPDERLRDILADSAPAVLLAHASLAGRFAGAGVPRVRIDADAAEWARQPETDPARGALTPGHLAYVIYTSGSTGRPKGVMNQHRTVVNRVAWGRGAWGLDASDAVLCMTSLSFDGSVREIFLPLASGARVVVARPGGQRDPAYLADTIRGQGITTVNLVPSMLRVLVDHAGVAECAALRRVLCGGEALPAELAARVRQRLPHAALHNLYGPSEAATALAALHVAAPAGGGVVPVGRPAANTRVYVLGARGEPVPVGVAGELYIGGAGVARGYLGRPALTAERFLPDPFGGEAGARLYRTGDLVRWRGDGELEFLGRNDFQVKVRGQRVEPGEVEARLASHPRVSEAVVTARDDAPGGPRLVAYYLASGGVDAESLRAHLLERLPDYMVPSAFVRLERWPLTPNGKLDRGALPAPEGGAFAARAYEAPANETEEALAEIWAEVLGVERVGRHDDFFELGGHSLLAVQVISRVRQRLEVEVPLGELFTRPVLGDFAHEVIDAQLAQFDPDQIAELAALLRESAGV
ncbi:MAG TPA: amino acid adenylation domain-containing protein [Longimicrobium sp.]|nr:amino acid adenylation domain-containing protein [Longimicrobium sp.]